MVKEFSQIYKKKQCPYKPGSVPLKGGACHLSNPYVTIRLKHSTLHRKLNFRAGNPKHDDGILELAAPSRHSTLVTKCLVVSYTTFSPLPPKAYDKVKMGGGYFLLP